MTLPPPYLPCPSCGHEAHHLLVHEPSPPGLYAVWPDPAAPAWRYECHTGCGHVWRVPADAEAT